jgi:hypothetical protein
MIQLNPLVRDLYCHEMSADWTRFSRPCPLPSFYAPSTDLSVLSQGPRVLLEQGLPYDLTLSGTVAEIRTPNGRLFTKFITFDGLSANLVELDHLVIVGDLVFNKAKIRNLELHDTIVAGKIVLTDSSTQLSVDDINFDRFNLAGLVVHRGIHLSGSSKIVGCHATFGDGVHSIDGPLLLEKC